MKAADAAPGRFDGGWWPGSAEPVIEFTELAVALGDAVGPISRVSYHLATWGAMDRKMTIGGRLVRFEGFRAMDPRTVVVIGADGRRVSLLVAPPGTTEDAADTTSSAAGLSGVEDAVALVPLPQGADARAEQRWEAEGGRVAAVR
ncbi:DUF5994 family protein [Saccharopolyspora gloriosae]|uniref:DUF5994 family protein n=1 Tax=Saccharopolyspora gloriosae TaxID=455344 RepID=UPI001FB7EF2F|nr:DUF5994 family protein [Saccharopolyspora gloriosae]